MGKKIKVFLLFLCFTVSAFKAYSQFETVPKCKVEVSDYWEDGVVLGIDRVNVTITELKYCAVKDIYRVCGYINNEFYCNSCSDTMLSAFDVVVKNDNGAVVYKIPANRYGLFTIFLKRNEFAEVGDIWVTRIGVSCGKK